MESQRQAYTVSVKGVGAYLPGDKVSIDDLDEYIGSIPEIDTMKYYKFIERFAGIKYRYCALKKGSGELNEDIVDLSYNAASMALGRANITGDEVDLIITTTTTPPYLRGGLAKEIRLRLGNNGCSTFDLWGACTGIEQAITLATAGIRAGMYRNALLVGAELTSTSGRAENYARGKVDRYDILLRAALGDGAGALVLSRSDGDKEDQILYTCCGTEGRTNSAFHREAGGSTLPLNLETFKQGKHHWHHDFQKMVKDGIPYFIEITRRTLELTSLPIFHRRWECAICCDIHRS
jgi:3-oxoacyl-[acyl-carrier-protein] synthase-3